jgi:periplasmic protein TonB
MEQFENEELTDQELSEMLGVWAIPVPTRELRARIFFATQLPLSLPIEEPWYRLLLSHIRGMVTPAKPPPLLVTSKPVEVSSIWSAYAGRQSRSIGVAVLLQASAVALLFAVSGTQLVQKKIQTVTPIFFPRAYQPKLLTAQQKAAGGGGGGMHNPRPVSHGEAPQFAAKTFIPPALAIPQPKLPVIPTITAQAPQIADIQYGDPLAHLSEMSGGPGSQGLGSGTGGGLGNGSGDGFGDGSGAGQGGGAFRVGGDVSAPILVAKVEPEYSEEARKAKYSGTVLLSIIVDVHGLPRNIHVVRPLGLGLDEKAVAAVQKWRFRPGTKGGRPVATVAQVEVSFRLL